VDRNVSEDCDAFICKAQAVREEMDCLCLEEKGTTILTTRLLDLDAGLLARSQNLVGPATGHLDPGFLGFPGS